jgi:hypothetical protein
MPPVVEWMVPATVSFWSGEVVPIPTLPFAKIVTKSEVDPAFLNLYPPPLPAQLWSKVKYPPES